MLTRIESQIVKILKDKPAQVLIIVFSCIFGFVKSLANYVYDRDEININFLHCLGYVLICYAMLNLGYFIVTRDYKISPIEIKSPRKLWWTFFFILLFSYVLCWLAYWPGTVFIDNWYISRRGLNLSVQHPILYCAFVQMFVKIGKSLGGVHYSVILFTGLQLLIVSVILANLIFNIFQKRIPKALKYISLCLFAFVPLYSMYSICNVKDIYWSLCLVATTIYLYDFVSDNPVTKSRKFYIELSLYLVGLIILRNNGIFIVIPCLLLLFVLTPSHKKSLSFVLAVCLFTQCFCSFLMKTIDKKPFFQEKAAVPIQQVASVVKNDGKMTSEQKKFVAQIMPLEEIKKHYDPYLIDSIKWEGLMYGFNRDFLEAHSSLFLKYWWQMMPNNLEIYIKAFLQTTYWFWAPRQENKVKIFTEAIPDESHPLMPWIKGNGYKTTHILPVKLQTTLHSYYDYAGYFFSEGILFWLLCATSLLYFLKRRKLRLLIIYIPCFLLWITLMLAAPDSIQFRYILSFAYLLPYFIALLFVDKDDSDNVKHLAVLNYSVMSDSAKLKSKIIIKIILILALIWEGYEYIVTHIPVKARVDVLTKSTDKSVFHIRLNGQGFPLKEASRVSRSGNRGVIIQQKGNNMMFTITALKDANINIILRGSDERDENGKVYERGVKYTSFKISEKSVIQENKDVGGKKTFRYTLHAKKNRAYVVQLKWRKK